jgi:hypothetical protein
VSRIWLIRAAASALALMIFQFSLSATAAEAVFVPARESSASFCALASI